ncbi:hypothetical protein CMK14_07525 [Candidatus Poribacteria bacterium]|nr:hypothetical protein [Candidatus Poribacteria bacterium]
MTPTFPPSIDRLASEGTAFNNAFTSCPLCTPARGTLLTALWPHQNGVYDDHPSATHYRNPCLSTKNLD